MSGRKGKAGLGVITQTWEAEAGGLLVLGLQPRMPSKILSPSPPPPHHHHSYNNNKSLGVQSLTATKDLCIVATLQPAQDGNGQAGLKLPFCLGKSSEIRISN